MKGKRRRSQQQQQKATNNNCVVQAGQERKVTHVLGRGRTGNFRGSNVQKLVSPKSFRISRKFAMSIGAGHFSPTDTSPQMAHLPYDPAATTPSLSDASLDCSKFKTKPAVGKTPVYLVSCGSFSPITNMHLRLLEDIRCHLKKQNDLEVMGGILSPVHDAYGKKGMVDSVHRMAMCRAATATSDWILADDWEINQQGWVRTKSVLHRFQTILDAKMEEQGVSQCKVLLVCGADLLESFLTPGMWIEEDVKCILTHGLAVMRRAGVDLDAVIDGSDLLRPYKDNIFAVDAMVENNVSSTLVRKLLTAGDSARYLIPDPVIDYIEANGLWAASN